MMADIMAARLIVFPTLLLAWSLSTVASADSLSFELVAASAETYAKPHDIVLSPNGKLLYVADNDNDRIAVLDAQTLKELGIFAKGEVSAPHDVVFDAQGRLLVADTGNSRIAIYEVDGARGRLVGSLQGRIRRPEGVAVHKDGRVFATGAASDNLVVYRDGKITGEVDGFAAPHDVEIDLSGNIWVADAANDRMVRLNDNLEITKILAGSTYDFNGPRYMDFDVTGRMYVADKYTHSIKVIAPNGDLISVLGKAVSGKGEGVFNQPEGVEIRDNDIWFSDTYNDRVVRYRIRVIR
ncbi:MAG: NHL repeat-containing protein [Acidiferrobacterales bacterium]|nr:NHL repeat-containing protein [Acidiferrobacterales bacterium]